MMRIMRANPTPRRPRKPGGPPVSIRPEDLGIGQLFELVPDAVIVADAATDQIVLWNPAAERMFGWTAAEAEGQPVDLIVPERMRARHVAGMQRYQATGHGPVIDGGQAITLPATHKSGRELTVEMTLAPIHQDAVRRFVIAIIRDATARLAAEEALRRANDHKDEFLNVISHELRTPLNFIMGFGSVLDDEVAGPMNERQHEYVRKIMSGSERMLVLINDLLDYAKIQAGRLQLDVQETELRPLVEEVVGAMRPLAERKGVALRLAYDLDRPVLADGVRVIQVLTNLVGNAVKFTAEGGAIDVVVRRDGVDAWIGVRDTGVGIGEADLGKIFEKFQQVDMSNTRRAGGTGLGLSISKALVEAMGGAIGVESRVGEGSTFWFTLPAFELA
jgi:PAS domain S-box-containing protein